MGVYFLNPCFCSLHGARACRGAPMRRRKRVIDRTISEGMSKKPCGINAVLNHDHPCKIIYSIP